MVVRSDISHSMLSDMKTINQDQSNVGMKQNNYERENTDSFEDYSTISSSSSKSNKHFHEAMVMGFEPIDSIDSKQNIYSMFSPKEEPKKSFTDQQSSSGVANYKTKKNTSSLLSSGDYDSDSIQKKFAGAKGISSDQFFGSNQHKPPGSTQIDKFQNSTSISSSDYFGEDRETMKSNSFGTK